MTPSEALMTCSLPARAPSRGPARGVYAQQGWLRLVCESRVWPDFRRLAVYASLYKTHPKLHVLGRFPLPRMRLQLVFVPLVAAFVGLRPNPLVLRGGCLADCHGNGACVDGVCRCEASWRGDDCGTSVCPALCHGQGRCESGSCLCIEGFTGAACESGAATGCPEHCSGHGWCIRRSSLSPPVAGVSSSSQCSCRPGWRGAACDVDTCPSHCSGHGTCLSGNCSCTEGWQGDACHHRRTEARYARVPLLRAMLNQSATFLAAPGNSIEPAAATAAAAAVAQQHLALERALARQRERESENARPTCPHAFNCSGRGDCLFGECHCRSGFSGKRCEVVATTCPGHCNGRGLCDAESGCQCALGYAGEDCGRSACAPLGDASFGGCFGRGKCVCEPATHSCSCQCQNYFLAPYCERSTCPDQCGGAAHGRCVGGACVCEQRWSGRSCAVEICPNGCSAPYGACVAGECVCSEGWTGPGCENSSCPSADGRVCAGHGACDRGKCVCADEWTAHDCSLQRDSNESHLLCANTNCGGPDHGICTNGDEGPCTCKPGWKGGNCTDFLCPSNCNSNGFCTDAGCVCYDHFKGEDCEVAVCLNDCSGHGVCLSEGGVPYCKCEVGRGSADCSSASNPKRAITADVESPAFEDGKPKDKADCEGGNVPGAIMLSQGAAARPSGVEGKRKLRRLSGRTPPTIS